MVGVVWIWPKVWAVCVLLHDLGYASYTFYSFWHTLIAGADEANAFFLKKKTRDSHFYSGELN